MERIRQRSCSNGARDLSPQITTMLEFGEFMQWCKAWGLVACFIGNDHLCPFSTDNTMRVSNTISTTERTLPSSHTHTPLSSLSPSVPLSHHNWQEATTSEASPKRASKQKSYQKAAKKVVGCSILPETHVLFVLSERKYTYF
jgi:hypothetical protein